MGSLAVARKHRPIFDTHACYRQDTLEGLFFWLYSFNSLVLLNTGEFFRLVAESGGNCLYIEISLVLFCAIRASTSVNQKFLSEKMVGLRGFNNWTSFLSRAVSVKGCKGMTSKMQYGFLIEERRYFFPGQTR